MLKLKDYSPLWAERRVALSEWFEENARVLPWRTDRSVYRTVVSEFMLQQTRVTTVIPYFERWTNRFPDFEALSSAEENEVLSLWQGLGYYSRARNLHKLAKAVAVTGVPSERSEWLKLPGIGPYSSAAIGSISQGITMAVVDGNVVRVLSRLTGNETKWSSAAEAVKACEDDADAFLDRDNPGRHNESVMELGALVCTPRSPLCTVCPLVVNCSAAAAGIADRIPAIVKTKKVEKTVRRAWIVAEDRVLLQRYSKDSRRLAGLMELPQLSDLPVQLIPEGEPIAKRKRGIGNESITEWIHRVQWNRAMALNDISKDLSWVRIAELKNEPLSGPHRRWIEALLAEETPS